MQSPKTQVRYQLNKKKYKNINNKSTFAATKMAQSTPHKLIGKVAIITGSSDGIGAGIAVEYSREGASVTLNGRNEEKLAIVAEKCQENSPNKHKPLIIPGDITLQHLRQQLISKTLEKYGKIDILVNNAGYSKSATIDSTDLGPLDSMLDIHVRAPYHLTKLAIPELSKTQGVIINISSVLSIRPCTISLSLEYGMAKAALDQFTQWMARELGPRGIRTNSINPAAIRTNIGKASRNWTTEQADEHYQKAGFFHALQRVGEPREIGRVAVFLASEDSSFVTGNILLADGGFMTMPTGRLMTSNK